MAEATGASPQSFQGPVFLVGMPRSGTKLLRGLLNQHARVGIPDIETECLPYWVRRWPRYGDLSQAAAFHAFYQEALKLPYFVYMAGRDSLISEQDWRRGVQTFDPAGVFEALIRHDAAAPRGSARLWGDKSPSYVTHLPLLKQLYPAARFIHIIRDVRDYVLSIQKAWGKSPLRAAQRWVEGVSRARADAAGFPADYLEIRYEDLLQAPEAALRRCCALLEIDFNPAMLSLAGSEELRGSAAGLKSIKRDNFGKWSTEMNAGRLRRVEEIAGHVLRSLDYPVRYEGPPRPLSAPMMRAWQAVDGLNLVRTDVHRWGLAGAIRFRWQTFAVSGNRKANREDPG